MSGWYLRKFRTTGHCPTKVYNNLEIGSRCCYPPLSLFLSGWYLRYQRIAGHAGVLFLSMAMEPRSFFEFDFCLVGTCCTSGSQIMLGSYSSAWPWCLARFLSFSFCLVGTCGTSGGQDIALPKYTTIWKLAALVVIYPWVYFCLVGTCGATG